jgi:hypothetical protein
LRKAGEILARLGINPGGAFKMLPAPIELREGLSFEVATRPPVLLNSEQQAAAWHEALGSYDSKARTAFCGHAVFAPRSSSAAASCWSIPQPSGGCAVK